MVQAERKVLTLLYRSTGGPAWSRSQNWNTKADISTWRGVKVNSKGRVVQLDLSNNKLEGVIPKELGNLRALTSLDLRSNELKEHIPPQLGNLTALERLDLSRNQLEGSIPTTLGSLSKLKTVQLHVNKLTGNIPKNLGALRKLQELSLYDNELSGPIPKELGALTELQKLDLCRNNLSGPIPPEFGYLAALVSITLYQNNLTGGIPKQLGNITGLHTIEIHRNQLSGNIPSELGAMRNLESLWLCDNQLSGHVPASLGQLTSLQRIELDGNRLVGGPMSGESLGLWMARLRRQETAHRGKKETTMESISSPTPGGNLQGKHGAATVRNSSLLNPMARLRGQGTARHGKKETIVETICSPTQGGNLLEAHGAAAERHSSLRNSSSGGGDAENLFRAQVASFAELDEITRDNHKTLKEVKRLLESTANGSGPTGADLTHTDKLQELDRLVAMAKDLGEVASKHMEDKDMHRKELALPPGSTAYYTTIRTGVCNAYLAGSVVGSRLVRTSKTGGMSVAGEFLNLLSGALPFVGGLAGFAAEALKAGDNNIQTRRVVKMTDLALDAVECCSLAKLLGLRLTDCLSDETITTSYDGRAGPVHSAAGFGEGAGIGACEWSQNNGGLPDCASEEDFMEWFAEEVASCVPNNTGKSTTEEKAGRRLGKRHIRMILAAVERGCLQETGAIEEKVERLRRVVVPEAGVKPVSDSNAQERSFEQRPAAPAPSHDGGLDLRAEFVAMQAKLEALEIENGKLTRKVSTMEKSIPKPQGDPSDEVDVGGGQALAFKRKVKKTQEEVWQEMAESAAAAGQRPVTQDQLRRFAEVQDERHREHDANLSWVQGALSALKKKKNRKWRR
ncbi:unnamed protein product [Ectocarpus sp. 12 AP-2014]